MVGIQRAALAFTSRTFVSYSTEKTLSFGSIQHDTSALLSVARMWRLSDISGYRSNRQPGTPERAFPIRLRTHPMTQNLSQYEAPTSCRIAEHLRAALVTSQWMPELQPIF